MASKSVKVVPANPARFIKNMNTTTATQRAKSGAEANLKGYFISEQNAADKYTGNSNSKTIKINSSNVTPQGTQPALRIRRVGGITGAGGLNVNHFNK